MTALQEYLNQRYPTKEEREKVEEIDIEDINNERKNQGITEKLEGGELDLSEYVGLRLINVSEDLKKSLKGFLKTPLTKLTLGKKPKLIKIGCFFNLLTTFDLSDCPNLTSLLCSYNQLISIDFLKQLPNPEKLTILTLANNNIEPTNLEFLRPFINISEKLTLGNDYLKDEKFRSSILERFSSSTSNRFYGSLEPLRNMTKLPGLCIDGTDVEEGLEYLPTSIKKGSIFFHCSPKFPNRKVGQIQDQLRPFNYDIAAWQLAHPEKMLISRPELFTNPDSKDKWLTALNNKILEVRQEIITTKQNEADKIKKIARLETKIQELEKVKTTISQSTQTELSTQDKSTQTDLTAEQIKQWEQANNQTWYQKIIDSFKK